MAKKEQTPEQKVFVTICSRAEKKPATFETRRYFEILGELTWRKADRLEAHEAAKWCDRMAKPGDWRELDPDILMEVHTE